LNSVTPEVIITNGEFQSTKYYPLLTTRVN
jgi:hypothetical protein